MDWIERRVFVTSLSDEVGKLLIELAQPRTSATIRQTIRDLFLRKAEVDPKGGIRLCGQYWKCFLRQTTRPLSPRLHDEMVERVAVVLGEVDLTETAARRFKPMPELTPEQRKSLEAVKVDEPSERLTALEEAFASGLYDFIPNLFARTYSAHGRRPHHPLLYFKVCLAMMSSGELDPARFLKRVNDSIELRLFLNVFSSAALPSARRIKAFLEEKLPPAAEQIVLWLNLNLLEDGELEIGNQFGTDGMEPSLGSVLHLPFGQRRACARIRALRRHTNRHFRPVLQIPLASPWRVLDARTCLTPPLRSSREETRGDAAIQKDRRLRSKLKKSRFDI